MVAGIDNMSLVFVRSREEFEEFLRTVTPLKKRVPSVSPTDPKPLPPIEKNREEAPKPLPQRTTNSGKHPAPQILQELDRRLARKVQAGKICMEKTLDLHTHTFQEAEEKVFRFIQSAVRMRMRWIMIITGKGSQKPSVLKAALPDWLTNPRISDYVICMMPAHPRDGGAGAFYIHLRALPEPRE